MAAITFKGSLRHWGRLFGYVLAVAVVGGAVAGGGLALLEDVPNWAPGGATPDVEAELLVGAGLLAVGALVLLAGFLAIVLLVVAEGVRFGVEAATDDPDDETDDEPSEDSVPDPAERFASRRRIGRVPVDRQPQPRRSRERTGSQPAGEVPPEQQRENERGDDPDQDEDWMREVERNLVDEEADRAGTAPSDESNVPPEGAEPTDEPRKDRDEPSDDDWVGADEIASADPKEPPVEGSDVEPERETSRDSVAETDVPTDRPATESESPVDDPLAPDDIEPDPTDREAVESAEETTDADDDSVDSDDEPE